jgi:hypothetical protein
VRDYLKVRCETTSAGASVILFNHVCGGSGCTDSNYGVIDTETGNLMLEPGRGFVSNKDEAEHLLGLPVRLFTCGKGHSDTSLTDRDDNGEYCFHTPLELP